MIAAVLIALPSVNLPENLSRQPRHGAWLLMIVAAAAYYPRFVKLPAGMETYPQATACLWHGQVLQVCDPGFTYPPFFALVMLPFVFSHSSCCRSCRCRCGCAISSGMG